MESVTILCEAFVPLYCLYTGYMTKKRPPKLGEKGLGTKLAMKNKETWDFANAYGAKLCFIFGGISGAMFILRLILLGLSINITFSLCLIAIELFFVFSIIPLINRKVKKTFGIK